MVQTIQEGVNHFQVAGYAILKSGRYRKMESFKYKFYGTPMSFFHGTASLSLL